MQQCFLCSEIFDGKTIAKLASHMYKLHNLSFEDYIIQTQYNGIAPKCICKLCNEQPLFRRGKFSQYALNHDKFFVREKLYREQHGDPTCFYCSKKVNFYRGVPRQFCSHICAGLHNGGFTQQKTQDKIKKIVLKKYGVKNVANIPNVRDKISIRQMGENNSFYGLKHNDVTLKIMSEKSKLAWANNSTRRADFKIIMHNVRKINWQNPIYRQTILQGNLSGKHSKLHQNISKYFELKELGFESEKVISRYRVDEVNFEKKIIVEINGDYIHANPNRFKENDLIVIRSLQYLAKDKWDYDLKRKNNLESLGFKVFIIWQSDDFDKKKIELYQLIGILINERYCSFKL